MDPRVRERLDDAVERLGPLPVLAGTAARVRELVADPESSVEQLVAVIEQDEAFAANLLAFANSATSVRPIRARTIRQALTLVGRHPLARLALAAETYRFLERLPGTGAATRGQMHVHALAVAVTAVEIAQRVGAPADDAHLAGLLHDVGKLVLPLAFGAQVVDEIAHEADGGARRAQLERDRLGVDHAYAGALLVERSGAGDEVVAAISWHHGGRSGQETPSTEAACVQLANALQHIVSGHAPDREVVHVALSELGLALPVLDEIAESVRPQATHAAEGSLAARVGALERLADTDELTGIRNRRAFLRTLRELLARNSSGTLLICDLDHFKLVNDRHGHAAGDLVLGEVARIIGRHGIAGRLGGDEFALWVPGDFDKATAAAAAIRREAAESFKTTDDPLAFAVSIGAAQAGADAEISHLLELADKALYRDKQERESRSDVRTQSMS